MDIVHEGFLIKSPPNRRILRAKWRERWFVLRHSGHLPGQFVLEYYTRPDRRKLRGRIDLDQCEQVDAGLTFTGRKPPRYKHMFDVRTPRRLYYLVAQSEEDMKRWVDCICSVCDLKKHVEEEYAPPPPAACDLPQPITSSITVCPTLTPARKPSCPYIPISECRSGQPVVTLQDEFYSVPKPIVNDESVYENSNNNKIESIDNQEDILDVIIPPRVNWNTYPSENLGVLSPPEVSQFSNGSAEGYDIVPSRPGLDSKLVPSFEQISLNDSGNDTQRSTSPQDPYDIVPPLRPVSPPPRPCKPPFIKNSVIQVPRADNDQGLYDVPRTSTNTINTKLNKNHFSSLPQGDGVYDFPRTEDLSLVIPLKLKLTSQKPHTYFNAPIGYLATKEQLVSNYDYNPTLEYLSMESGYMEMSSLKTSPDEPPPLINRNLKPKKSSIDETAALLSEEPLVPQVPEVSKKKPRVGPVVDQDSPPPVPSRGLKPLPPPIDMDTPTREDQVPPVLFQEKNGGEIHYLDLDLENEGTCAKSSERSTVVYKTVDFVKTKALIDMKVNVEDSYKQSQ